MVVCVADAHRRRHALAMGANTDGGEFVGGAGESPMDESAQKGAGVLLRLVWQPESQRAMGSLARSGRNEQTHRQQHPLPATRSL